MAIVTEEVTTYCERIAIAAKAASRELATSSGRARSLALQAAARKLLAGAESILAANAADLASAQEMGLTKAPLDRLKLDDKRLKEMARAIEEIAAMPDPLGQVIEGSVRPNGLEVRKVRVPLGVILFIYESRPNVTADAAALCVKSGNAVILRGGKEAKRSNLALARVFRDALVEAALPSDAVVLVETTDRAAVGELLKRNEQVDLAIPRGGEELIRRVAAEATMPVLKHYKGVCHVYVDASADLETAVRIVENAKCQRPGVCNAAETLLIDKAAAESMLGPIGERLRGRGVELRACPRSRKILPWAKEAHDDDFGFEFLDLVMAVKIVDGLDDAIGHIANYSSGHTEAIVTRDLAAARRFVAAVDSSAVMVNASTRFNDGGQLGLGAEIGISTDKFHARGPCGLGELTSYKYVVMGDGQVRE